MYDYSLRKRGLSGSTFFDIESNDQPIPQEIKLPVLLTPSNMEVTTLPSDYLSWMPTIPTRTTSDNIESTSFTTLYQPIPIRAYDIDFHLPT
jgi:hypothetical protein